MSEARAGALVDALRAIDIGPGDIVFLHSNVTQFLKLPLPVPNKLQFLLETLLGVMPKGTLAVPTFTYSFCRRGIYDSRKAQSEVGLFPEIVRRDPRAMRSEHAIFSVAAIGPDAPFLCKNLSNSSYGPGSVFERFYVGDAKVLNIDVPVMVAFTYVHYPEQFVGVPYRYSKYFRGTSIIDGETSVGEWELYARCTERWDFPEIVEDTAASRDILAASFTKKAMWEGLLLTASSCRGVFDLLTRGLRKDPYYLLAGPPTRKDH